MRLSTIFVPFLLLQGIAVVLWQMVGGPVILWVIAAWLGAAPVILAIAMIRSRRNERSEMSLAGDRHQRIRD
jgi:uncharacterized membrane protein